MIRGALGLSALCLLLAPVRPAAGQLRMTPRLQATTCSSADSALGPLLHEPVERLGGWFSLAKDTTRLSAFLGAAGPVAAVNAPLIFAGRRPHTPKGLVLGLTFTGSRARAIAADTASKEARLLLEPDSTLLTLGPPFRTALNESGSSPAITVNLVLTRASYRALMQNRRATVSWGTYTFRLSSVQIAALRALYRAALCAPEGVPAEP